MKTMRKIGMFFIAAAAVACGPLNEWDNTPYDPSTNPPYQEPLPDPNEKQIVVFTANVVTKTALVDDKSMWVKGDKVKFLWDGGEYIATTTNDGEVATFRVEIAGGIEEVYAVYPPTMGATVEEGELVLEFKAEVESAEYADVDVAVSHSIRTGAQWAKEIAFKPAASLVRVGVTSENASKLTVSSSSSEYIAGKLPLVFNENEEVVFGTPKDGVTSVSMDIPGAYLYYLPIFPNVTLSDGLKVTVHEGETAPEPIKHEIQSTENGKIFKVDQPEIFNGKYYVTAAGTGAKTGLSWVNAMDVETFKAFVENADNVESLNGVTFKFAAEQFAFGDYIQPDFPDVDEKVEITFEGTVSGSSMTTFKGSTGDAAGSVWPKGNTHLIVKDVKFTGTDGNSNRAAVRMNTGSAKLTLESCVFEENKTSGKGAAVAMYKGHATIKDCEFLNNTARTGAALVVDGNPATVEISGCVFKGNYVTGDGDAEGGAVLYLGENGGNAYFSNSTFKANYSNVGSNTKIGGIITARHEESVAAFDNCIFDGNYTNREISNNAPSAAIINSHHKASYYFNACEFKNNTSGTANGGGIYGGKYGMLISIQSDATLAMNNCYVHDNFGERNIAELYWIYINNTAAKFLLSNSTIFGDPTRYSNNANKSKDGVIALRGTCNVYMYNSIVCSMFADGSSVVSYDVVNEIHSLYSKTSKGADSDTVWSDDTGSGHDYYGSDSCFLGLDGYMWAGTLNGTNSDKFAPTATINSAIQGVDADFYTWLESIDALGKDIDGNQRGATSWPGCYQK